MRHVWNHDLKERRKSMAENDALAAGVVEVYIQHRDRSVGGDGYFGKRRMVRAVGYARIRPCLAAIGRARHKNLPESRSISVAKSSVNVAIARSTAIQAHCCEHVKFCLYRVPNGLSTKSPLRRRHEQNTWPIAPHVTPPSMND